MKVKPYRDQDYKVLKDSCVKSGTLFTDKEFPPDTTSLSYSGTAASGIEWKRPGELVSDPKLFVDGASVDDFSQGALGNCWFVAACSSIAGDPKLWKKVVPDWDKQEWNSSNKYAGIFHFRFFRLGEWYDVVIDDFLPTKDGKLVYCSSQSGNEFWSALLEKAYAKIFGDYESLKSGHAKDALADLMGGVGESVKIEDYKSTEDKKNDLFKLMREGHESHSLMCASITGKNYKTEQTLDTGLIATHAYSITKVKDVKLGTGASAFFKREKIKMVRCRNPWGKSEWTGPWSDNSPEWQKVSDKEKVEIGLEFENDGEFWMSFDDFCNQYTELDICHLINTSIFSVKKSWKENLVYSEWKKPNRAGGCFNHDSKLDNPQFVFDILEDQEEIIVSLEQEDARIYRELGKQNATIGFTVIKADLNRAHRMHDFWEKVTTSEFINSRSVCERLKLKKGRYVMLPATFDPGHEGKFMLRVYGTKDPNLSELTTDGPAPGGGCMKPRLKAATSITILKAVGLEKQDLKGGADPYCIIKVDDKEIKIPHVEDSLNPEWNWRATFYKKKFRGDIFVEVWNHNLVQDEFMGRFTIMAATKNYTKKGVQEFTMLGKGKEAQQYKPGRVYIEVKHYEELDTA